MIAEGQHVKDVASKRVTTAPVAFGLAVGRDGTDAGTCRLGGTGFEGIAIIDKTRVGDEYIVGENGRYSAQGHGLGHSIDCG